MELINRNNCILKNIYNIKTNSNELYQFNYVKIKTFYNKLFVKELGPFFLLSELLTPIVKLHFRSIETPYY